MPKERALKLCIAALAALLIASNAWWFYQAVDHGVTLAYRDQALYEASKTTDALSKLSGHLVKGKSKAEATALLQAVFPEEQPYQKEGALHITWLALSLDSSGAIQGIQREPSVEQSVRPPAATAPPSPSASQ